jgi:hypothetical protein
MKTLKEVNLERRVIHLKAQLAEVVTCLDHAVHGGCTWAQGADLVVAEKVLKEAKETLNRAVSW